MTTFDEGRIKTCLFPFRSALTMLLSASFKTLTRTILEQLLLSGWTGTAGQCQPDCSDQLTIVWRGLTLRRRCEDGSEGSKLEGHHRALLGPACFNTAVHHVISRKQPRQPTRLKASTSTTYNCQDGSSQNKDDKTSFARWVS